MKKHSVNITYIEGLLLATHCVSVSALYSQHTSLVDQIKTIEKLTCTVDELNRKLLELKISGLQNPNILSTQIASDSTNLGNVFPYIDYINPKVLLGIVCIGVCWYSSSVILAKVSSYHFPTFKSLLVPLKSKIAFLLPFVKEKKSLEAIQDGLVYKVVLEGDNIVDLSVRSVAQEEFTPITSLITDSVVSASDNIPPQLTEIVTNSSLNIDSSGVSQNISEIALTGLSAPESSVGAITDEAVNSISELAINMTASQTFQYTSNMLENLG